MGGVVLVSEGETVTASLVVRLARSPTDAELDGFCDALIAEAAKRGAIRSIPLDLPEPVEHKRILNRNGHTLRYVQVWDIADGDMVCKLDMKFEVIE